MTFYTGITGDGSDMKEFEGVYLNPDNDNEWGSTPYLTQMKQYHQEQKEKRMIEQIQVYMGEEYTLDDVYNQIQNKTCKLSRKLREVVLSCYDDNGQFINH